jgi:hypothetical protein
LRSWLGKFVLGCATISLWAASAWAQTGSAAKPAIALIDPDDAPQWQTWTGESGWQVVVGEAKPDAGMDARVQALEAGVNRAIETGGVDPARVYLAGRGDAVAAVFYAISRVPDLWAGAVALGGSPQPAIDSDRLYTANFANVPLLWISAGPEDPALAEKLRAAGLPLEWRSGAKVSIGSVLVWLKEHARPANPRNVDCETNSPAFSHCYWIRLTKFDANERNDVLPSSRIEPTVTPALDLGGFGFKPDDPGPGVLISFLPEKYSGALKLGDRIVALDGREIANAKDYVQRMKQITEERPASVLVQRGRERNRIETKTVLPKRLPAVTARVQGKFGPGEKEIQIISRTVTEMRVVVPLEWVPAQINWNGVPLETVETPGCRLLTMVKELESAVACP